MSTPRKKTTGFSEPAENEEVSVEKFLDENAQEMFETISLEGEPTAKETPVEKPFVPMEITPTPDNGPRFVEEASTPHPQVATPAATPQLQPPPKRHPRNIPKFSRLK
jgi:hypothetical protein